MKCKKRALEAIKRARVQLLIEYPFFGVLAAQLEPKDVKLPTYTAGLGTNGRQIYYDPEKIMNLEEEELQGSIAHEVLHAALGHIWRREGRKPLKWNVATDYAVNSVVIEAGGRSRVRSLKLPEGALFDEKYKDTSAEEIYRALPSPHCPQCRSENITRIKYKSGPSSGNKRAVKVSFKCGSCGHEWTEKATVVKGSIGDYPFPFEESDRKSPNTIDDHSKWRDDESGTGRESANLREKWKRWSVRAAQQAKSQGSLPAGLERLVEDLLYPKIEWRKLLSRFVTRHRGSRFNWKRPNKRWIQQGIYYPVRREEKLSAAVAIDTSGSVSDDELRDFLSELRGILSCFQSFKVRMFAADADVHTDIEAESLQDFDEFQTRVGGGGGTDYRPVFEKLEGEDVDVLVYLGDMYATFPDSPPDYDVIWVVSEEGDTERPPFGEVVEM